MSGEGGEGRDGAGGKMGKRLSTEEPYSWDRGFWGKPQLDLCALFTKPHLGYYSSLKPISPQ